MPQTYGRYEAAGPLGRGGMGVVLRGRDPLLERPVAIKVLKPDPEAFKGSMARYRDMFLTEARTAAKLVHPNIVTVYDVGLDKQDHPYIVMEIVDGRSLADIVKQDGPVEPSLLARIGGQLADALGCAHEVGLIHRDVKPANALLASDGTAKLMDFGLANFKDQTATEQDGRFVGSLLYASPEQVRGRPLDPRSDLFSLGLTLYVLLTGKNPFRRADVRATATAVVKATAPPASSLRPGLDPAWDGFFNRALAKERDARFVDAGAMALALAKLRRLELAAAAAVAVRSTEESSLELVVVKGPDHGQSVAFGDRVVLGRAAVNLRLTDSTVSGRHCEVERVGERIVIRDLESRNGTWVGGDRISVSEIEPGTVFRVGNHTTVRLAQPDQAEHMPEVPTMIDQQAATALLRKDGTVDNAARQYTLEIVEGPSTGSTLALEGALVLSRAEGPGGLGDAKVSRKHASVEVSADDRVFVRDLASTNGTFRGDQRVREFELELGGQFRVGATILRLAVARPQATEPAAVDPSAQAAAALEATDERPAPRPVAEDDPTRHESDS